MDERTQEVFESIGADRDGVDGMYRALLHHPELAARVEPLGRYLRFQATVPSKYRELAILSIARELGAGFVWVKHDEPARRAGLPDEVIRTVLERGESELSSEYADIVKTAVLVHRGELVPEPLHGRLEALHGRAGLVELVSICGFYRFIAAIVSSFACQLESGEKPPF